ncbi:hypothetical protein [Martelella mediterranea]|uniref:hypothetical protein n=1 Tax=Martelella mediterranea TaxID=293089 RepID=UPI00104858FB|nr:hypothetical protein [Martelella mediterranea]
MGSQRKPDPVNAPAAIYATVNGASTDVMTGERQLIGGWNEHEDDFRRKTRYVRADLAGDVQALHEKAGDETLRALMDVINERYRQIAVEGWTPEHDDQHCDGQLALAASTYALNTVNDFDDPYPRLLGAELWPFDDKWWKPTTPRRDLTKAAALILAEIERLDRAEQGGAA